MICGWKDYKYVPPFTGHAKALNVYTIESEVEAEMDIGCHLLTGQFS